MNTQKKFELHWPGLERCIVWDMGSHYYLVRIMVKEEWRGHGIGSAVIRQLQRRGLPIEVCSAADRGEEQDRLDRFYYGLGFKPNHALNHHQQSEGNLIWKPSYNKPFPCDIP